MRTCRIVGASLYDCSMPNPLIDSLLQVLSDRPDDVPLRLHVAELLIADGRGSEAVQHCAVALQQDPSNQQAHALLGRALPPPPTPPPPPPRTTRVRTISTVPGFANTTAC